MSDNIDLLKEKLDLLIATGAPYSEIYELSDKIDDLISNHYEDLGGNQPCENNSSPSTIAKV